MRQGNRGLELCQPRLTLSGQASPPQRKPVQPFETLAFHAVYAASVGFVDPGDGRQLGRLGWPTLELGRVGGIGGVERLGSLGQYLWQVLPSRRNSSGFRLAPEAGDPLTPFGPPI
jgi:hypothetical protein